MTDTQHLQVAGSLPSDPTTTPSGRGHRHKRSLAISGDFDFLKQPISLPPLPCNTPEAEKNNVEDTIQLTEPPGIVADKQIGFEDVSTRPTTDRNSAVSPRFFISEEPKFSSPFHGVPDAIINLDDALKTKPKSFKSHRRSESAPAELTVLLSAKTIARDTQMIEEEDDDLGSDADRGVPVIMNESVRAGLLSPLRPSSPSPMNHAQSPAYDESPARSPVNYKSDNLNTLKINRQKQRYYHYTKKLPMNSGSNIQPQSLREKASSSSLSSACVKTPLSVDHTPSKQVSTPSTPVTPSCLNTHWNSYGVESSGRLTSPFRSQQLRSHKFTSVGNTPSTSFGYESRVYDRPHGRSNSESVSSRDDRTLNKKDMSFADDHDVTDGDKSVNDGDVLPISRELLFGQPGDSVDLSSLSSPSKEQYDSYKSSSRENSILTTPRDDEDIVPSTTANESSEPRSVSDSAFIVQGSRKGKRKMRSRLNVFFMNIFKNNNQDGSSNRRS